MESYTGSLRILAYLYVLFSNTYMSLLDKSHEYHQAFLLLREHKYSNPAVHCCYYSCFQKMGYILKEYYPEAYSILDKKAPGSHDNQTTVFCDCYYKVNQRNSGIIKRYMEQLKELRKKSDYHDAPIGENDFQKVESFYTEIHKLIKQDLKL